MKALKYFTSSMRLLISAPIWYYLMYSILKAINPDRLVWFLFWIYVPSGILLSILEIVVQNEEKK